MSDPGFVGIQWPVFAAALVKAIRGLTGYATPGAYGTRGIPVFLGPETGLTMSPDMGWLCIGWSGDPDAPAPSGETTLDAATIHPARTRAETGVIRCMAVKQSGNSSDKTVTATINGAYEIVQDVDRLLRSNPQLDLPSWVSAHGLMVETAVPTITAQGGIVCMVEFTISYSARLSAVRLGA